MWKQFIYGGRERVAWVAPEGPAYQVLDAGKPVSGFRAFVADKMEDVKPTQPRFDLMDREDVEHYPELKLALHL